MDPAIAKRLIALAFWAGVLAIVAWVLLSATHYGSSDQGVRLLTVFNRLDEPVRVWAEVPSGTTADVTSGGDIPPGGAAVIRYDLFPGPACSSGSLLARTARGETLARSIGPVCPGDDWVVDPSGFHHSPAPN